MEPTENKNKAAGAPSALNVGLDAGSIAPSMKRYRITWPHNHKTLRAGDVVVMTETPRYENVLLREPDMTLHSLKDENDQYVHLTEAANGRDNAAQRSSRLLSCWARRNYGDRNATRKQH